MTRGATASALVASLVGLALAGNVALTLPHVAYAATPNPLQELIDQGKYWQAHNRGDLAEQAWEKVLHADPNQPDALLGMGIVMVDRKDVAAAQQYLQKLRQVAPNYPGLDQLSQRLGQTTPQS